MMLFPVQSFRSPALLTLLALSPWTFTNGTPQVDRRQNDPDPSLSASATASPSPSSTATTNFTTANSTVLPGRNAVILHAGVTDGPFLTCGSTINNYTNHAVVASLNMSSGCTYFVNTINEQIPGLNLTLFDFYELNPEILPNCSNAQNGMNYCLSSNANTSAVSFKEVPIDAPVQGIQVDVRAK
ncbi:hypothetical protein B0H13DRAFT_2650254 [Mycena leptocephala]|nr:hypothetical protein B0H13DRAFT_2650254 [Mycena leptocephala]